MPRFLNRFASPPQFKSLILGISASLTLGVLGCEEVAPSDDADVTAQPSDAVAETTQVADIDLSLPETTSNDRELRSGQAAWVGHVTDGDTLTVWVGEFAPHAHIIRLVGLAAPECFKESRTTPDGFGNSCTSDDEIDGVGSFEFMRNFAEDKQSVITCEVAAGQVCPKDTFGRSLAYVAVNGKDAAVESAKAGHALSYVTFYSSKRKDICAGVYSARDRKVGMWSLGTETYVISRMNASTQSWYKSLHDKRCDEAMGR